MIRSRTVSKLPVVRVYAVSKESKSLLRGVFLFLVVFPNSSIQTQEHLLLGVNLVDVSFLFAALMGSTAMLSVLPTR